MQRIGEVLKNLETLIFVGSYHEADTGATESAMAAIGKGCPHLTTLKTSSVRFWPHES
jgi:hypothetical protein